MSLHPVIFVLFPCVILSPQKTWNFVFGNGLKLQLHPSLLQLKKIPSHRKMSEISIAYNFYGVLKNTYICIMVSYAKGSGCLLDVLSRCSFTSFITMWEILTSALHTVQWKMCSRSWHSFILKIISCLILWKLYLFLPFQNKLMNCWKEETFPLISFKETISLFTSIYLSWLLTVQQMDSKP